VATVVLPVGLGFFVVGWTRFPDHLEVVQLWSSGALLVFPHNQSTRGLALRAFTTSAYNQPLHVVPWHEYAVPILIGLLAVGSWTASISHSDSRTESTSSVEYGLTMTTTLLVLPLVSDLYFVWLLAPISAMLLVTMDNLRSVSDLLLLAVYFVVALYLSYPAVQDKTYAGHQALLYGGELVDRSEALCTGACP
jgi:hypothetical protein